MLPDKINLHEIDDLSVLSGLPESIMASDILTELEQAMMHLGKPEKEVESFARRLFEAFSAERDKAVEACYMAGYLKGMSDMAQRMKHMLESRGEMETTGELHRKVA